MGEIGIPRKPQTSDVICVHLATSGDGGTYRTITLDGKRVMVRVCGACAVQERPNVVTLAP